MRIGLLSLGRGSSLRGGRQGRGGGGEAVGSTLVCLPQSYPGLDWVLATVWEFLKLWLRGGLKKVKEASSE